MEGEDDLDILASLLEDDDDELLQDELESSLHTSDENNTSFDEVNDQAIPSTTQNNNDSSKVVNVMSEQMRLMEARIKQLEQELQEKEQNKSEASISATLPSVKDVSGNKVKDGGSTCKQVPKTCNKQQNKTSTDVMSKLGEKKRIAHSSNTRTATQPKASTAKTESKVDKRAEKRKGEFSSFQPAQKQLADAQPSQKEVAYAQKSKKPMASMHPPKQRSLPDHDDKDVSKERFSGLRIINPLISSVTMAQRMEGRKIIPISQIESKLSKGKDKDIGDWVTIGALATKLPPKTSANGNTYGIWKLSDLGMTSANDTVALFLFGEVFKQHWKTVEGSVVALLNAGILPAKEKNSQDVALTLDNPKKLMLMGISKDYGHCRGSTRKDGKPCTNIINKEHGDFCEYHVNAAYKKIKSNRMEFQAGAGAPNKAHMMNKLQKDMSSSSFMYQGKTLLLGGPAPQKSKNLSLKNLGITDDSRKENATGKGQAKVPKQNTAESSEFLKDLLTMPSFGTRNLIRHLHKDEEEKKPKEERIAAATASELLRSHQKELTVRKTTNNGQNTGAKHTPMLGRGMSPGLDIVFDFTPTKPSSAKRRALSVVRQKGTIEKDNPNAVRKKRSPSSSVDVEKRVEKDLEDQQDEDSTSSEKKPKRRRLLGPEFGDIDLNSKEGKRLLSAKSIHVGQVKAAQEERQEQYFSALEKKEQLEEKMKSIKEIEVKVYCCKKCDYIAESASDICYKENHPIKKTKAAKRFFSCKKCKQRTISYGSRIPKLSCQNCGEMNYERASMYIEKKGPKIGGETLLVRGEEHAKFMNSSR